MFKTKTSDWLLNPISIFSLIWLYQLIGHIIFIDSFHPCLIETWLIIILGFISFITGCFITPTPASKNRKTTTKIPFITKIYTLKSTQTLILIFLIIQIAFIADSDISLSKLRETTVSNITEHDNKTIIYFYLNSLITISSIFSATYISNFKKSTTIFILINCIISSLLTTGRTLIFLDFTSITTILYFQSIIKKKTIIILGIAFITLFISLAFLLEKGESESNAFEKISWNIKVYSLSGLMGFNEYIATGEPNILGPLLVPNQIKTLFNIPPTPTSFPFVYTPLPTNIYTAYFPWFHDGGVFGVILGFVLFGFTSMYLFKRRYTNQINLFLYSISLYPLIMTIFDEQYIRAYPLWAMVFLNYISTIFCNPFKKWSSNA